MLPRLYLTEGRSNIIYAILSSRVMDIGRFIVDEVQRCANAAGKATLGYISLVTHLCTLAGVNTYTSPLERPRQELDYAYFHTLCSVAPQPR